MALKRSKVPILLRLVQWVYPRLEKVLPSLAHRFFITIFFTPMNYRVPDKEKVLERQADKFDLYVGRKRIQCYSWGEGPTVLVVHGWAGRATQFRKIISALVNDGFRVIGFDGPAHGHSEGRSTNIMEFAAVLTKLYETIGKPVAIIAHSFGGGAVLYAAMKGLEVEKLINVASPSIGDEIIATYLKTIKGSPATATSFKAYIEKTTGKPFEHFTALHFITRLPRKVELLLIHDEDDPEVPLNHALEMIIKYPAATLYRTQGLGHTRILRGEAVISKCLSFIKG